MSNVWSGPDWRIECGDCLELLKTLPSGSVDCVVTDPPYGVKYAEWDAELPPQSFLDDCLRVSRGPVIWFGASSKVLDFAAYSPRPCRVLVWAPAFTLSKTGTDGAFYRWHPILVWRPEQNGKAIGNDVLRHSTECGNWWNHPATKPVVLMVDIVDWCCADGGAVLDPFMGSGTTGVACLQTGRKFIGFELDRKYCELGARRLADVAPLFRPPSEPQKGAGLFAREEA